MKKKTTEKNVAAGGIKIRLLNYVMIIAAIIIYSLVLWQTIGIQRYYGEFTNTTQGYIDSRNDALELQMGSDYLTSQARLFATTGEKQYSDNFFYEIEVEKRRDKAVEGIKKHVDNEQLISQLDAALKMSNELTKKGIYSMRLVVEGKHYDVTGYNQAVQKCVLSAEDAALSDAAKLALAESMLLDEEYRYDKGKIETKISNSIELIIKQIHYAQMGSAEKLRSTLIFQMVLLSLLFIMSVSIFLMIVLLVIKPLNMYMECIRAGKPLKMSKAYEFNYLARTYNNIYELNEENKNLQYTAAHDGLTGVFNRGAFDDLSELAKNKETPIALLIIDIDNFKTVNDTYGHDVGDKVLKKLANALSAAFRVTDCVARLGGDEFAVIMMNVNWEIRPHICELVDGINKKMADTSDGVPKTSVSAGIAFSQKGYSDGLYKAADAALYKSKSDGKGRYSFYGD